MQTGARNGQGCREEKGGGDVTGVGEKEREQEAGQRTRNGEHRPKRKLGNNVPCSLLPLTLPLLVSK